MKKIIRRILKEERQEQFLNKVIMLMKDDFPLFKNLKYYGFNLSEEELNYVLSGIFGQPVTVRYKNYIFIYDQNGNQIYYENSFGNWEKWGYDENGNQTYYETSEGFWVKREYDEYGNEIYYEYSYGDWEKREYDEYGNEIYYENSNGYIRDNR